ncbi:hypothetical protein J5N97_012493 [Dioscorea zingiberensis]|uniref:ABC transmembrane type-1 domain-containing protein n=1 Tax=Dioscorea zingiberensis TaxID=325984 RepID=A0A9D5CQ87_9LILI|nr:hypothetical protein J5N97_012493 [Dioscorea zingiberensis]
MIPLLVVAGGVIALMVSKMASRRQEAYAEAANVVEQAIGSIRTDASFTGEKIAVSKYNKFLRNAYLSSVQEGLAAGLGGKVLNVIFALIVGSL